MIHFDSKARAFASCPDCNTSHHIRKQTKHLVKPRPRLRCKSCGCSFLLKPEEQKEVLKFYKLDGAEPGEPKNVDNQDKHENEREPQSLGSMILNRLR